MFGQIEQSKFSNMGESAKTPFVFETGIFPASSPLIYFVNSPRKSEFKNALPFISSFKIYQRISKSLRKEQIIDLSTAEN